MKPRSLEVSQSLTVIGWQECISLPELSLQKFAIKVDTGAKTTALHADDIQLFQREGERWVRFRTPDIPGQTRQTCEFPVHTRRDITNTSGQPERRIVIRTPIVLARRKWMIDISLTDRAGMRFPLILGRRALRHKGFVVHPGRTYLVSRKPKSEGMNP